MKTWFLRSARLIAHSYWTMTFFRNVFQIIWILSIWTLDVQKGIIYRFGLLYITVFPERYIIRPTVYCGGIKSTAAAWLRYTG